MRKVDPSGHGSDAARSIAMLADGEPSKPITALTGSSFKP
jgi:hypothetical protein